jgi:hypothetical protein
MKLKKLTLVLGILFMLWVGTPAQRQRIALGQTPTASWTRLCTLQTGVAPWNRVFHKPVYDPDMQKTLWSLADPNPSGHVFSNAVSALDSSNCAWTEVWKHGTDSGTTNIGSISAAGGVASISTNTVKNGLVVGDPMLTLGVTPDCFNGNHPLASVIDNQHWTYATNCPDGMGTGGQFTGPANKPSAPSDRHVYHIFTWDAARHLLDTGFGSSINGGVSGNCPDCGDAGWYTFDPAGPLWVEQCGWNMTNCPANLNTLQSSAGEGVEEDDVVVIVGGLLGGTPSGDTFFWRRGSNTWYEPCGTEPGQGLTSCGFANRSRIGMAAIGNHQLVFFGGFNANNAKLAETWMGTITSPTTITWTKASSTNNPPATAWPPMTWVPSLKKVVLIGAETSGAHVWEFDPATGQWTDANVATGPTLCSDSNCTAYSGNAAYADSATYDPKTDRIVLMHIPDASQTGTQIWTLGPMSGSIPPDNQGEAIKINGIHELKGLVVK